MIFYSSTIPTTKWLLKRCCKKCIWQILFPKLENSWRVARMSLRGLGGIWCCTTQLHIWTHMYKTSNTSSQTTTQQEEKSWVQNLITSCRAPGNCYLLKYRVGGFSKNVVADNMVIHQRKTIGAKTYWE